MTETKRICVFAGSRPGALKAYGALARSLGMELALRGVGVIYGGGATGLMGAVADAALGAGGEVIGIIPHRLQELEVAHAGLSELILVDDMLERKAKMAELSDAFIALPGGLGTLDEVFEMVTWSQLGFHDKPMAMLEAREYWQPLKALLDHCHAQGFVGDELDRLITWSNDPSDLLDTLGF